MHNADEADANLLPNLGSALSMPADPTVVFSFALWAFDICYGPLRRKKKVLDFKAGLSRLLGSGCGEPLSHSDGISSLS